MQAGGQGFEPPQLHQVAPTPTPGHHLGPCGSGLHLRLTGACQTTPVDSTLMAPVGCAKHAHSTRGIKASQGTILASLKTEYVENSLSSRNCDQALLSNPGLELRGCRAIKTFRHGKAPRWYSNYSRLVTPPPSSKDFGRSSRTKCVLGKGQARKGTRWMPWHREAMKDVGSCEKPRGVANTL